MARGRSSLPTSVARAAAGTAALVGLGIGLSACSAGGSSSGTSASSGSCDGVSGAHHARVVVEPSAGHVLSRCVGFDTATVSAVTLLHKSGVELGTQDFGGSLGLAICQADDVPSHYSTCLPSGADYWALFVSTDGKPWASPPVGVSQIVLHPGDSLGLRYDSPQGNPAAPPAPSPA